MSTADVVVIGGGPAGLAAAARIAADARARVVVVDEGPRPGGRLPGQLHRSHGRWVVGAEIAADLVSRAERADVEILSGRQVWACEPGWRVSTEDGRTLTAPYVVVATGAAERPLPMPGWTLPGVLAVGAVQNLLHVHRVLPGDRVAVIGTDPLALAVAEEVALAGGEVVGVFLPSGDPGQAALAEPQAVLGSLSRMAGLAPTWWARLAGRWLAHRPVAALAARVLPPAGLRVGTIPVRYRQRVEAITGDECVRAITVRTVDAGGRPRGSTRDIAVDAVCLSGGLHPQQDLAQACSLVSVAEVGGRVPLHAPDLRSTSPGLYVAGSVTGIEGAPVAQAQGELVGTAIAAELDAYGNPDERVRVAVDRVRSTRAEAAFSFLPDIEAGRDRLETLWAQWQADQVGAPG